MFEVLRVISSSPEDLQPVFETILANATRLCGAKFGMLFLTEGNAFRIVALHNAPPAYAKARRGQLVLNANPGTALGRAAATKRTVQVADIRTDPAYSTDPQRSALLHQAGARTILNVPMLKGNALIGQIGIFRQEVQPFTDKQIELVQNFADQAVIAIENTRLLNDLRERTDDLSEALEQQTATSQVLQVISGSPGDLQPVFEAMLANATRICGAKFGALWLCEGDGFRAVGRYGLPPALAEWLTREPVLHPNPERALERLRQTHKAVQITDIMAEQPYRDGVLARFGGARTLVSVPMLKENELIGAISIYRQEVQPFTDKQIELVTNFANQAVIAIENTRLLNELRESLQQQTATSEVLQVISSSPGDLDPVFQAMLTNATRICEAKFGNLLLYEPYAFRHVCAIGEQSAFLEWVRRQPTFALSDHPHVPLAKLARTKQVTHIVDLKAERGYIEREPRVLAMVESASIRTMLLVPMLKEEELIGAI